MFGHIPLDSMLLFMLYAMGMTVATIACLYLLLRRGNAFAPDIVTPDRLRRWTAVFFASVALGHLWYMPAEVLTSDDAVMLSMLVGVLLDCLAFIPLTIVVLLCMLQDRRRPLWPAFALAVPPAVEMVVCIATRSDALVLMARVYVLLIIISLIIYMVRAVRQYGRWLRDNYADLEHKEVWQSFMVVAVILLMLLIYVGGFGWPAYEYIVQACGIAMVCYLLWRVETLSDLSIASQQSQPVEEEAPDVHSETPPDDIELLLQRHCIDSQLYLQHELTVTKLARAIGTNHFYLSQYFARLDTNYNAYINDLRIDHFVRLYREAVANQSPVNAQQLASKSGYRSYSTFSLAFKQRKGQSVTAWMRDMAG